MDNERILCAGFGGQGVMSLGKLIAFAGMLEGREVTWLPSYGPEMRGGTAYCCVVVADTPVGSPITVNDATCLIVMNQPSFVKFEGSVVSGGLILMNRSLIDSAITRADVQVKELEANRVAAACGAPQAANMVMLGAYMALRGSPGMDRVGEALEKVFGSRSLNINRLNREAVKAGMQAITGPRETRKAA